MEKFNHLSPAIDRIFRSVEMIGVTALLGTITEAREPLLASWIILIGTVMAINYLIEPPVEWLAGLVVKDKPTRLQAFGAIFIFAISMGLTFVAAPYVSRLASMIGATIK